MSYNAANWDMTSWYGCFQIPNVIIGMTSSYFVWQERNNRIHVKGERNAEQVSKVILDTVRLKLASIKFKKNMQELTS